MVLLELILPEAVISPVMSKLSIISIEVPDPLDSNLLAYIVLP